MKSEVYEVSGSFKGKTLLPMPSGVSHDRIRLKVCLLVLKKVKQKTMFLKNSLQSFSDGIGFRHGPSNPAGLGPRFDRGRSLVVKKIIKSLASPYLAKL